MSKTMPIIDLFAGPGGLGEGFSAFEPLTGSVGFRIALSIEMDHWAHQTLALRAFYNAFPRGSAPSEYYQHLRGEISRDALFERHPDAAKIAAQQAWKAELGRIDTSEVDRRIRAALGSTDEWVLCGGPPCQAYSVVGRSRTGGISAKDHRVYLYLQYLRILAAHEPPVFIMENVKGLLSSQIKGNEIFGQMLADLRNPGAVIRGRPKGVTYSLYSLVAPENSDPDLQSTANAFVVRCEDYGIPQCRHRVVILGVRSDVVGPSISALKRHPGTIPARDILRGLPRLRSGLSRAADGQEEWQRAISDILDADFMRSRRNGTEQLLRDRVINTLANMRTFRADRGQEFIAFTPSVNYRPDWFLDPSIGGVCNHTTRPHMASDLHRYLFVAAYARVHGRSPELRDFPIELHPQHRNIDVALSKGYFDDRFRVQMADRPATTITSHIAKDGHYFIHYDETQCRSLTVREAARLQTFPDNYYFCGPRTHQYRQVGNAVPPLLATQMASIISGILSSAADRRTTGTESVKRARHA